MNCKKCGAELNEGYRFCSKCGSRQGPKAEDFYLCQKCGSKIPNGDKFCGFCGLKQGEIGLSQDKPIDIDGMKSSNNMKNLKVRRLTQEDKVYMARERNKIRRPGYLGLNGPRGGTWKIAGSIAALVLIVSLGVYFLNTTLFGEEPEIASNNEVTTNEESVDQNNTLETNTTQAELSQEETLSKLIHDFNEAWIGFVNNDSTEVFQYIVPGSDVESNILNFKKQGVKEEFLEIKINDTEVVGNEGYLKVHEEIKKTQNGSTTIKEYDWIYEVENNDGEWLIRNYTKDQNPSSQF